MQTLLVLSLLRCRKTSDMDLHWHTHKTQTIPLNRSTVNTFLFYSFLYFLGYLSSYLSFSIAVPAPTDLGFGVVGPDSMEVTWVAPHVPNPADINSFLIRYKKKPKMFLKLSISLFLILSTHIADITPCCWSPYNSGIIPSMMKMTWQKPAQMAGVTMWC